MENDCPKPFSPPKNFRIEYRKEDYYDSSDVSIKIRLSRNLKKSPELARLYGESFIAIDPISTHLAEVSLEKGYVKLITDTRGEYDLFRILVGEGMDLFNSIRAKGKHRKK